MDKCTNGTVCLSLAYRKINKIPAASGGCMYILEHFFLNAYQMHDPNTTMLRTNCSRALAMSSCLQQSSP